MSIPWWRRDGRRRSPGATDPVVDEPTGRRYNRAMVIGTYVEAVDLFCGVGGLTCGLQRAGLKVVAGIDTDRAARTPFESNNGARFVLADIRDVTADVVGELFSASAVRLLAGCAPCQPFSALGSTRAEADLEKWVLLQEFARLVKHVRPELVTMENVIRVVNHEPYHRFLDALDRAGYWVDARSVRCVDLGVPQDRRRHVLVASRLGPIRLEIEPARRRTVRDAIGHLPEVVSGGVDSGDPLHRARGLSELNLRRLDVSVPGGTWRDWPEELRAPCHRSKTGASYKNVYARMRWDRPAPTITTQCYNYGAGRFGHPAQRRALTLREAALLQSFPSNYAFCGPDDEIEFAPIGRMIGNAVPPLLGEAVGRIFTRHVSRFAPRGLPK